MTPSKQETLPQLSLTNTSFATAMGSLWFRGWADKVYRYDARTPRPAGVYPADTTTGGYVAIGCGLLWVSYLDANTLWRVRITH